MTLQAAAVGVAGGQDAQDFTAARLATPVRKTLGLVSSQNRPMRTQRFLCVLDPVSADKQLDSLQRLVVTTAEREECPFHAWASTAMLMSVHAQPLAGVSFRQDPLMWTHRGAQFACLLWRRLGSCVWLWRPDQSRWRF